MQVQSRRATLVVLAALVVLAPACTSGKKQQATPGSSAPAGTSAGPGDASSAAGAASEGADPGSASATDTPALPVDPGKPDDVARKYLELWQAGDFAAGALLTDADPVDVQEAHDATSKSLRAAKTTVTPGAVEVAGDNAIAMFQVTYELAALGTWTFDNELPLERVDDKWVIRWTPSVVYPGLLAGQRLARTRSLPERGAILDAAGKPLFTKKEKYTVGIEPQRLKDDGAATYAALVTLLKIDAAAVKAAVAKAKPNAFVQVAPPLTLAQYTPLRPKLSPLPGVVFRKDSETSSDAFARALLGRVGEATAEVLENAGGQFQPGDQLGLSGLQQAFQDRLTGTPIGEIVIKTGTTTVESVKEFTGDAPQPVKTTIDIAVQTAAEKAVGNPKTPASLVAIRASTGEILAVVNRPSNSSYNTAFRGRYPPGSTFKVVSTAALLKAGLKSTDTVPCPATFEVLGKTFRNFKGESQQGTVPFSTDFAHSCNTAFVSLTDRLPGNSFLDMASAMGIGRDWKLPLPAFTGNIPPFKDQTELAASMIGQGRVLVSPLDMAMVTAAVANGTWRAPVLVTDPPSEQPQQTGKLDPAIVTALQALMRQVVVDGTGGSAAAPGAPVSGKTGTAEFGDKPPLPTHAWFVGFRGDIAMAVIVEGGGVGGQVAAPIAGAFFKQLP